MPFSLLVIGGSAGALEPLQTLMGGLPRELRAAVLIVIHRAPSFTSYLPDLLARRSALAVAEAEDNAPLQAGRVYVAPPNQHLLVSGDRVRLSRGPKENFARPSIDVLFRSAAVTHGSGVTAVLLSGMLDDGTSGLWAVKALGGVALVQDPQGAEAPEMPLNALKQVDVDEVVKPAQLAARALHHLSRAGGKEQAGMVNDGERRRLALELGIASEDNAFEAGFLNQGELSPFSCPECNGAMVRLKEGGVLRFRCHTGHAYSQQTLLAAVRVETEAKLWQAVRVLDESVMLLEHLARHYAEAGLDGDARAFAEEAQRTRTRSVRVRQEALQSTEVTRLPPDDVPPDETQTET